MESENTPGQANPDNQLGKTDAAKMLNISPTTLDRWVKQGYINPVRLPSGRRRFQTSEIQRVLSEMTVSPAN